MTTATTTTPKAVAPYGWVGGALMLNKVSTGAGASWKVQVDPRLTIEATDTGYLVKDALHSKQEPATTLKQARAIINEWLQARPEAKGKNGIPKAPKQEAAPQPEAPQVEPQQAPVPTKKPKAKK